MTCTPYHTTNNRARIIYIILSRIHDPPRAVNRPHPREIHDRSNKRPSAWVCNRYHSQLKSLPRHLTEYLQNIYTMVRDHAATTSSIPTRRGEASFDCVGMFTRSLAFHRNEQACNTGQPRSKNPLATITVKRLSDKEVGGNRCSKQPG